jgi:hypothetical protein
MILHSDFLMKSKIANYSELNYNIVTYLFGKSANVTIIKILFRNSFQELSLPLICFFALICMLILELKGGSAGGMLQDFIPNGGKIT